MGSKHLIKPTASSSDDDDDEVMETSTGEEKEQNSEESSSEEDEEHSSEESSSEEDEPTDEKQQQTLTPPSSVVAATETKRDKKKKKEVCGGSGKAQPSTKKRPSEVTSTDDDEGMETLAGEEEQQTSNESSSDDEKQQQTLTPPSSVVAATETKRDKKKKKKEVCGGSGKAQPSTKKRPSEVTSTDDVSAKRSKQVDEKPSVKRLEWSEQDEIRVLQGMIQFKAETGKDPIRDDKEGAYEFVKESLSFDVYFHKFVDKMYSLKKKYVKQMKKGEELSFAKPHDENTFELSKLFWGSDVVKKPEKSSERIKKIKKDKKAKVMIHEGGEWFHKSFMAQCITRLGGDEDYVKSGWNQVSMKKKKMLEEKWIGLLNNDFKGLVEKTKLVNEVASEIVKASTH